MHVSLTPQLEALVRQKVESGLYNNASEVIREALRLMSAQDEVRRLKLDRLRQAIAEGETGGVADAFSFDELQTELDAEAEADKLVDG
jgi:antitoxin ParD1/3/4